MTDQPEILKTADHIAIQAYNGNGNHDWELVAENGSVETCRLRVPGGWLYATIEVVNGRIAQSFVPSPVGGI